MSACKALERSAQGSALQALSYLTQKRARGFWTDVKNQREFLETAGSQLGVHQLSDWYGITRKEVTRLGGRGLFRHHTSLEEVLKATYPEEPWQADRFARTWRCCWSSPEKALSTLEQVEAKMGIKSPEDWRSVTLMDLREAGFPLKKGRMALVQLLKEKYPEYECDRLYRPKGRYAQQKRLERVLSSLFLGTDIRTNVRKEADLVSPETGEYLELDVYIPSLQLAFEYQEKHHYAPTEYADEPLNALQARDRMKRQLAERKGICIIPVPFWWDGTAESLVATIKDARPDLLRNVHVGDAEPIPEDMPPGSLLRDIPVIEDIGQPTTACVFNKQNVDPTNWWMFEKYDGVRGFWNPVRKAFYSRHGNRFVFPKEIVNAMPNDIFLDGEIWFGRDNFQEAMKVANRMDSDLIDWDKFKFVVYDVPNLRSTYRERYTELVKYFRTQHAFIEVAQKEECEGRAHLEGFYQGILDLGGEGVIVRDPAAPFQAGRCQGYLKHKKFRDAEAKVIACIGSHQWECELPNGIRFTATAGSSDFAARTNIRPGDIVSFKHHGFLIGTKKPKFPTLYRLRGDLSWEDIVNNWKEQKSDNSNPVRLRKSQHRRKGFWNDVSNQRYLVDGIGKEVGVQKLADWYGISRKTVKNRGGASLFGRYGSLPQALNTLYPEYPWTMSNFIQAGRAPRGHWQDKSNLLRALTTAESTLGVQKPEDWYSVRMNDLKELGIPSNVTTVKLGKLLAERYPNHNWDKVSLLRGRYGQQRQLEKAIETLFPEQDILINARKEASLINPESGEYLELDVYIPALKLAFEYQEKHHYTSSVFIYQPLEVVNARDNRKRELAAEADITLIDVPCWWDRKLESLAATIQLVRPEFRWDLPVDTPIPKDVPPGFFDKHIDLIEDIGQPTTACFLTQAKTNPSNWWMFEKYDGVRAFWNPRKRTFYSSRGKRLNLPQHVIDSMPHELFLDGELWFGLDTFQEAMKIVHKADESLINWTQFRYMVFDVPTHNGCYEERYKLLDERLSKDHPYIYVAPKEVCKNTEHLEQEFQTIIDKGGEGIILRDPSALLQKGRSAAYLKHKRFRDAEAIVISQAGPYQWECELYVRVPRDKVNLCFRPNGVRFTASATTELVKKWLPKPGDIVSFKHRGLLLASKAPKCPTLYRLRPDLVWQDIVNNWKEQQGITTAPPFPRGKTAEDRDLSEAQPLRKASPANGGLVHSDWASVKREDIPPSDFAPEEWYPMALELAAHQALSDAFQPKASIPLGAAEISTAVRKRQNAVGS